MTPSAPGRRLAVLLQYAMANGLKDVVRRADLARALEIDYANLTAALQGKREFTLLQVQTAAGYFGFSVDGIFGFSDQAFRKKSLAHLSISVIAQQMGQSKSQTKRSAEKLLPSPGAS